MISQDHCVAPYKAVTLTAGHLKLKVKGQGLTLKCQSQSECVHLLLGNDLAGNKVVVDPLLTSTPCVYQLPDPIEQEIPDLYLSCAITRAMAKKSKQNNWMQDINLADTLIGQSFNDEISNSLSPSLSDIQTDFDTSRYIPTTTRPVTRSEDK